MKIGLFGRGRLGGAILEQGGDAIHFAVTREAPPAERVDVAIDVSVPEALSAHLAYCRTHDVPLVLGTTGREIDAELRQFGEDHGLLLAPNFSITVALLARLTRILGRFANQEVTRDPYLVEHHHARKRDAPSGTANLLAAELLATIQRKTRVAIPGHEHPSVQPEELSVSAIRAGSTYSSHDVIIDAPGEVLTLRHEARNVQPYADGALAAARWMVGRRGLHTMAEVAEEALSPLFQEKRP